MTAGMSMRTQYNVPVPTAYGTMIVNRNDWMEKNGERFGVGWDLLETGRYAQGELDHLRTLIGHCRADPVLLDVGANIGVHSLLFAELAGARGRVYAFEAQRIVYQMLMGNLALNSIENVYARQVAVGAEAGELRLPPVDYASPWNFGGMGLIDESADPQFAPGSAERSAADKHEIIPMISVDSLNLERADFIKVDVEGMELDVMRGALNTIERHRPLMQVEWWGRDHGALPRFLIDELGYRVCQAGMNLVCIPVERVDISIDESMEITLSALQHTFKPA